MFVDGEYVVTDVTIDYLGLFNDDDRQEFFDELKMYLNFPLYIKVYNDEGMDFDIKVPAYFISDLIEG